MEKTIVTILGVIFLAIGILGFVNDPIIGIFDVNALHNLIHLVSGALALWAVSMGVGATRTFSQIFGIVYGAVAVLGFVAPAFTTGLIETNLADNILHVVLALIFLYVGFGRSVAPAAPTNPNPMAGM